MKRYNVLKAINCINDTYIENALKIDNAEMLKSEIKKERLFCNTHTFKFEFACLGCLVLIVAGIFTIKNKKSNNYDFANNNLSTGIEAGGALTGDRREVIIDGITIYIYSEADGEIAVWEKDGHSYSYKNKNGKINESELSSMIKKGE